MSGSINSRYRWLPRGRAFWPSLLALVMLTGTLGVAQSVPAVAACSGNAIVCENQLPGSPQSEWDISGAGDPAIQGFATQISVNAGSRVDFKIKTDARAYTITIYRLGYYNGDGARKIATVNPSVSLPQTQPACVSDPSTSIYDCGTWAVSASWNIPSTAVSGVYIALLDRPDTGGSSHIVFVVRNDGNTSAVLYQTSDSTWQAYNLYGGADLYSGGTTRTQAVKVSYNRPFIDRGGVEARDWVFSNEYPMIRFLEQNGYDVSYVSGLDVSTDPNLLPKHKVFLSVGHDEYWSKPQRANVTAARDAGVNLAFFSGNEVYWKTRWEPSQDGTNTPNRTLVTYKDTWSGTQDDPVEPTATWRDPRFGDLGFGPENGLTGTMFMANHDDLALTVNAEEGKYRIWRNTGLASLAAGSSVALADHTVGYESDEVIDNGSLPAGLIRLSTTNGPTPEYLQDYGLRVKPGTTTHHITTYRAASGALVFSAGTIQWSWGLDSVRDGTPQAADPRIRQATANILADMSALPTTLASDLVMPSKSTDTTAPTAQITSPAAGSDITQGSLITVTGTASDTGGRVAGVEVSVDGGATFHAATGTTSWKYTDVLSGNGPDAIQARATDDSANTGAVTKLAVTSPCPCSLFGAGSPATVDSTDSSDVTLGVKFTTSQAGYIHGIRFYKAATNVGSHTGTLYSATGQVLATGTFVDESTQGWQNLIFDAPVPVQTGTTYVAAYRAPQGHYSADSFYFKSKHVSGPLTALAGGNPGNGVYADGGAFPTSSYQDTNYWVDAIFSTDATTPATFTKIKPLAGSTSVLVNATVSGVFSKAIDSTSLAVSLVDGNGQPIPGSKTYDSTTHKLVFNPTQGLALGTTYSATVSADGMVAPSTWSFTTVQVEPPPSTCPCSLFAETDQPASGPDSDTSAVTLGVAFSPSEDGVISGVRFFKNSSNTGTHTVALWDSSGKKLAEATPASESSAGWQTAVFASPVGVSADETYTASYRAPVGRYSYTAGGLASPISNGPLTSLATGGRYTYGTGAPTTATATNYYVDVIYDRGASAAPAVTSVTPADAATSVPVNTAISATFTTSVEPGVTQISVKRDSDGAAVAGTVSNESQGSSVSFLPASDLDPSTKYRVTISGAKSLSGVTMTGSFTSVFTTAGALACPCSLLPTTSVPALVDSLDTGGVTLGLKFSSTVAGKISGLRYYRAAANTGSHKGNLWASDGTKLAEVTFTDGAEGWTTAKFATPVSITANTTYVASYYTTVGHYSADLDFFAQPYVNTPLSSQGSGGVYTYSDGFPSSSYRNSNYYVDVLFETASDNPPTVTAVTPAADATSVAQDAPITATFSKAITESSLNFTLATAADGVAVPGVVTYNSTTRTATLSPGAALNPSTQYTVTVTASSTAGVVMDAPKVWSFTTSAIPPATVTATTPTDAAVDVDPAAPVTATFSASTQANSVSLTLSQGTTNVAGTLAYDQTTRIATFTPLAPLASLKTYTVSATASNTNGVAMAPKSWTFTTKDVDPATFASLSPVQNATNAALATTVTAVASKAIDQTSLVFGLKDASGNAVAGTTTYDPVSLKATFTPTAALTGATTYTASVAAKTQAGIAMPSPVTWSFTTVDLAAPVVSSTTPASAATGVAVTTKVTAVFAKQIDPATLVMSLSPAVAGTTTYDSTTRTATFSPNASLASATTYTASVNAKSTGGTAMASAKTWTFATADVTPPVVSSTTPAASATGVALGTTVTAVFAKQIDPATLTMSLSPAVTGTATYNSTTRTATFTPSAALTSSTTYTATVNAKSTGGAAMTTPKTWTFTTTTADFALFAPTATPTTTAVSSLSPVTVGVAFQSSRAGRVVSIRFWAASTNTGRTVTLRNASGTVLGTANTSSTATGWRTATFSTPISITANTTYVASYYAPLGMYAQNAGAFATALTNGPLSVPVSGGRIGSGNVNPTTATTNNMWVDVLVRI